MKDRVKEEKKSTLVINLIRFFLLTVIMVIANWWEKIEIHLLRDCC